MTERTCSIEGCERAVVARGWCQTHWRRWRRNGDPGTGEVEVKVQRQSDVCAVDGCERERVQRDWCRAHYARWRRHGNLGTSEVLDRSVPAGCKVEECDQPHDSNGYCTPHAHRLRRYGDPTHAPERLKAGDPTGWRNETVGYMGAHNRVRRLRGNAKSHTCQHCGGTAHDWAYDHRDPNQAHEAVNGYDMPYSSDPAHYMPLCKSCHVKFDS